MPLSVPLDTDALVVRLVAALQRTITKFFPGRDTRVAEPFEIVVCTYTTHTVPAARVSFRRFLRTPRRAASVRNRFWRLETAFTAFVSSSIASRWPMT